ncbi:uncharacterized protein RCC_10688 [Ramularia collo-cygni]|uniref:Uncharacterized protein n=1 Tax=Ramularia collo-cygni TaxID=112498 RepID=A0A2D3VMB8_9PEZI|nr:uncharacterized protein RCC_10688 [Ramularia collo-cygni]CZT24959.1 uncharacterized protein RCC_10688 [Ramularia collo-cygni]
MHFQKTSTDRNISEGSVSRTTDLLQGVGAQFSSKESKAEKKLLDALKKTNAASKTSSTAYSIPNKRK